MAPCNSTISLGFHRTETNCRSAHISGIAPIPIVVLVLNLRMIKQFVVFRSIEKNNSFVLALKWSAGCWEKPEYEVECLDRVGWVGGRVFLDPRSKTDSLYDSCHIGYWI